MPHSDDAARTPAAGHAGRRPDFVVIGAMKCGTSTLHDQLGANPQLFVSEPKEPNFFSDDAIFARGLDWYESLFAGAGSEQLCGESSTHYTKRPTYPEAADRLHATLPHVRLIYVVREPLERLVSQYVHEWSHREVATRLADAVSRDERFVAYSRYAMQVQPYLERFGADRVCLVFFERLVSQPQLEIDRIAGFLGVEGALRWRSDREARNRSSERLRSSPLRDAIIDVPFLAWLRRRFVPQSLRDRVKRRWQLPERPTLDSATRAYARNALDPDLARLGEWLGTPLDCERYLAVARASSGDWSEETRERFPVPPRTPGGR